MMLADPTFSGDAAMIQFPLPLRSEREELLGQLTDNAAKLDLEHLMLFCDAAAYFVSLLPPPQSVPLRVVGVDRQAHSPAVPAED